MHNSMSSNKVLAIIIGLFSIGYLVMAFQIPSFSLPTPIDSDLFPKVLGFSLLFLAILLFFEREKKDIDASEEEQVFSVENTQEITQENNVIETTHEEGSSRAGAEQQQTIEDRFKHKPKQTVFIVVCAIGLYIFVFEILGFLLSTFLFTFIMTYFFGYRRHWINGAVALLIAMVLYFGLSKGLDIYLPQGWIPL